MKFDDFNYTAYNQIVFLMGKNNGDKNNSSPSYRAGQDRTR